MYINNKIINLRLKAFLLLIFLISVFYGCKEPNFSDKGIQIIDQLRMKYSCYDFKSINFINSSSEKVYLTFEVRVCNGELNFDSLSKNDTAFIKTIADEITVNCTNKNEFKGVELCFINSKNEENSSPAKHYIFNFDDNFNLYYADYYNEKPLKIKWN